MFYSKIIKKGAKAVKGKKSKGNKGNPGTNRKKKSVSKSRPGHKGAPAKKVGNNHGYMEVGGMLINTAGMAGNKNMASELYEDNTTETNNSGNSSNVQTTNQVKAMKNLTQGNSKLMNTLQQLTGSTNLMDWAMFFKKIPPEQRVDMIAQSRIDDKVDEDPTLVSKIRDYAMSAADIYARATGKDHDNTNIYAIQEAEAKKKQNLTYMIIAGVVITVLFVAAILLRSPKKYV